VAKKWYSYFVVTDDPKGEGDAPAEASAASVAPKRVTDVAGTEDEPTFTGPVTAPVDLGSVYEAAKIEPPAHGYTVLKVAQMLESEHLSALPVDVKRRSIMVALDAAGVNVADVVEDAVRRDRALDTYERVLQKHLEDARAQTAAENRELEDEITRRVAELRAAIEANTKKTDEEVAAFRRWQTRKRQEEDAIAGAVSVFVSENPVTTTRLADDTGEARAGAKGENNVR
jgi:hypothetical protein